jgi:hypothetical protein
MLFSIYLSIIPDANLDHINELKATVESIVPLYDYEITKNGCEQSSGSFKIIGIKNFEKACEVTEIKFRELKSLPGSHCSVAYFAEPQPDDINTPLLKLLFMPKLNIDDIDDPSSNMFNVIRIIQKYKKELNRGVPVKQVLWQCQKEMIEQGFDEVAKWE